MDEEVDENAAFLQPSAANEPVTQEEHGKSANVQIQFYWYLLFLVL